ncbi:MAG: FMN-binding protein [Prevotella sp.]|nr:FMN-binding protein [Prevotella sp.]
MNTNSNTYIIIYSAVLVIIVAFLLAFVFQALKPLQDANVELDVKKQILYSLNIRGLDGQEAEQKYNEVVTGKVEKGELTYYGCQIDGQTKYVFPLKGMGLWGGISGFVSVNDDLNTIYGAYFNHESETAGLGAEIKDSQSWQEKFKGKAIFDKDGATAIAVVKKVEEPASQVDCVTGATLTSNGVSDMLRNDLAKGVRLLKEAVESTKAKEE